MPFYEYFFNITLEHPVWAIICFLCFMAMLDKVKEILDCIFTKGHSEQGNNKSKSTDNVVEPDYIVINNKKEN